MDTLDVAQSIQSRDKRIPNDQEPPMPQRAGPHPLFQTRPLIDHESGDSARSGPTIANVEAHIRELEKSTDDAGLIERAAEAEGAVAFVHFDSASVKSNEIEALIHTDDITGIDRGMYVTIRSTQDDRTYAGRIVEGPFFDPDVLKRDSTPVQFIIMNQGNGKVLSLPEYHARAKVELLGEERAGALRGVARRPHPGSPIFPFDQTAMNGLLHLHGAMRLGELDGYEGVPVLLDTNDKNTLPRNLLTVGTVGSGKSNTDQVVMEETAEAGWANVVIDPEGEFTLMNLPAETEGIGDELAKHQRQPKGIQKFAVYRPPRCESKAPNAREFSVPFESLSPDLIAELTHMNEVQRMRFAFLYEQAVSFIRKETGHTETLGDTDDADLSKGYSGMTLGRLIDMLDQEFSHWDLKKSRKASSKKRPRTDAKASSPDGEVDEPDEEEDPGFYCRVHRIPPLLEDQQDVVSYGALRKKLRELKLTQIFDRQDAPALDMKILSQPGTVSVVDMSDCDDAQVRNIIIADLLARMYRYKIGLTEEQNTRKKVLLTLEEAHGFVSRESSGSMSETLGQLRRIARRGRKRWLALHFVTQSPQHLPSELFELANNKIIHQITGAENLKVLKTAIGSINEGIWSDVPTLGRGRAVVVSQQYPHPLIVRIRPAASKRNFTL